jgi:drug/metabolite transporter (DMT)-like permease
MKYHRPSHRNLAESRMGLIATIWSNRRSGPCGGRLWILAAALMWSSSGLFAKAPIFDDWPAATRGVHLAFWRALFAVLVLLPAIRRPRWRWELVPLSAAFAGMNAAYLTAMTLSTAANAIWLQNTCPWWVFLVSLLVFRQRPDPREFVPLVFGMLGVGVILAHEIHGQAATGVALGLASGILYAWVVVLMARLRAESSAWLVTVSHAVAALTLAPWTLTSGVWPTTGQFLVLAAFGALQMAVPYLCLIHGLRTISSQEAVAIGLIEPVALPLWVFLVWGECPAYWTIMGAVLILIGLLLRYGFLARPQSG